MHHRPATIAATLAACLVPGCVSVPGHRSLAAPAPRFDAVAFFTGPTAGEGVIRIKRTPERMVRVAGQGLMEGDTLILDQHVEQQGNPPTNRRWRLRATGPDTWSGTLSDAAGPVSAATRGNMLTIRYHLRGGLMVRQWIALQPGGQVALNRMAVFKFGLPVARLTETIRRIR